MSYQQHINHTQPTQPDASALARLDLPRRNVCPYEVSCECGEKWDANISFNCPKCGEEIAIDYVVRSLLSASYSLSRHNRTTITISF